MRSHLYALKEGLRQGFRFALGHEDAGLALLNAVSHVYKAHIIKDLSFHAHPRLNYDLYLPPVALGRTSTPVIVFFHGGSWREGNKNDYVFIGRRLAHLGYITAIPNYRLYPEVAYPVFLDDCALSVRSIQQELSKKEYAPWHPCDQVVLMGHSAGAYNAAMLAFDASRLDPLKIRGLIGLAGPYNFYPIDVEEVKPVFHHPHYHDLSQPIERCTQANAPCLLICAEKDEVVNSRKNSQALLEALQLAGTSAELHTLKNTTHAKLIAGLSPLFPRKNRLMSTLIHQLIAKGERDYSTTA